jgi:demethylmenaquinone methyltransferase/2-methoxy-6-polyprenyl-1,4-benzoquinol methylase
MTAEAKVKFFDGIADKWDGWEDLDAVAEKLALGLDALGVAPDEAVLDVGCGTGNLTLTLLQKLSQRGRVVAIDISVEMIRRAREKVADPRVDWHVCDAARVPIDDRAVDRVICCSVWPHFDDPGAAIEELRRVLRPRGALHVWHLSPRATINEIHASAGEAVAGDVLVPAAETARLLEQHGLDPYEVIDDETGYLVSARRPPDHR